MKQKKIKKILLKAIRIFGVPFQWDHLVEEYAELIASINHYKRGKVKKTKVFKELADSMIKTDMVILTMSEEDQAEVSFLYMENVRHLDALIKSKEEIKTN